MSLVPNGDRTTTSIATFRFPFRIGDDPTELAAGNYVIHTRERIYAGNLHAAYVAESIELEVRDGPGRVSYRLVKPAHFETALAIDRLKVPS